MARIAETLRKDMIRQTVNERLITTDEDEFEANSLYAS